MTLYSMTGFARVDGAWNGWTWSWEIKSVNSRGLDIRSRLPSGQERLEPEVRARVSKGLVRGAVNVILNLDHAAGAQTVRLNQAALAGLSDMIAAVSQRVPQATPPSIDGLLGLRWLVDDGSSAPEAEPEEELTTRVLGDLERVIQALRVARGEEGDKLKSMAQQLLDEMMDLFESARALEELRPDALRRRLRRQIDDMLGDGPEIDEDRLAQEVAVLAVKLDIREELDRFGAHLNSAVDLVKGGGAIGRKLDFLCQEFNREANTLCSKSQDIKLTQIGLDLKSRIDQLREQVQNIE